MVLDVPNAFIQTNIPPKKYFKEREIMKITSLLVAMLFKLDSETSKNHTVVENKSKVIYVYLLRAIYGMLVAEILLSKKFVDNWER